MDDRGLDAAPPQPRADSGAVLAGGRRQDPRQSRKVLEYGVRAVFRARIGGDGDHELLLVQPDDRDALMTRKWGVRVVEAEGYVDAATPHRRGGGVEVYVVEHETDSGVTPLEAVEQCLKNLKELRAGRE